MPALLAPLAVGFFVLALAELVGFLIANHYFPGWVILLAVLAGLVWGIKLAVSQFRRAWRLAKTDVAAGATPTKHAADAVLIALAGLLLAFPGFVSDALALLLFVPGVRSVMRKVVSVLLLKRFALLQVAFPFLAARGGGFGRKGRVIDGEIVAESTPPTTRPKPGQLPPTPPKN